MKIIDYLFEKIVGGFILAGVIFVMSLIFIKTEPTNLDFTYFLEGMKIDFPNQFNALENKYILSMQFIDDPGGTTIAMCYMPLDHIQFGKVWWKFFSDIERRAVLYHEVAHCVFKQEHRAGYFLDGCPISLMNPYIPSRECLDKNWEYYKRELFNYDI